MVIDASATVALCLAASGFDLVPGTLQAPVLIRSEVLAAIQEMQWRQEISPELAEAAVTRLLTSPIRLVRRDQIYREAKRLAESLGWAKTYDAEYLALARLTNDRFLTADGRLARRARNLVEIVEPHDLARPKAD